MINDDSSYSDYEFIYFKASLLLLDLLQHEKNDLSFLKTKKTIPNVPLPNTPFVW